MIDPAGEHGAVRHAGDRDRQVLTAVGELRGDIEVDRRVLAAPREADLEVRRVCEIGRWLAGLVIGERLQDLVRIEFVTVAHLVPIIR